MRGRDRVEHGALALRQPVIWNRWVHVDTLPVGGAEWAITSRARL
jgi:hypothetical protein